MKSEQEKKEFKKPEDAADSGRTKKKSRPRKRLTKAERQRQIRIRIGISASVFVVLIFTILYGFHLLPLQKGTAVNLTAEVLSYQKQVEEACQKNGIPDFSPVVLAIMQQESAGTVPDVMQASESPMNTLYPNTPGAIPDPYYSIEVGVETFAYCLDEAGCTSPYDENGLKLALQNYNYGNAYATWALEHYGGYSAENAVEFSENMKAKLGWSQYGDTKYVEHVLQYYRTGF